MEKVEKQASLERIVRLLRRRRGGKVGKVKGEERVGAGAAKDLSA